MPGGNGGFERVRRCGRAEGEKGADGESEGQGDGGWKPPPLWSQPSHRIWSRAKRGKEARRCFSQHEWTRISFGQEASPQTDTNGWRQLRALRARTCRRHLFVGGPSPGLQPGTLERRRLVGADLRAARPCSPQRGGGFQPPHEPHSAPPRRPFVFSRSLEASAPVFLRPRNPCNSRNS